MRILVLGAGVSGKAAAQLAIRLGHTVTIFDENPGQLIELAVGQVSGSWDGELLDGIDLVVTSPGFSERSLPIVESLERGLPVWSEIEFAWRHSRGPVLAVTGTNGKTTISLAAAAMLNRSGVRAVAAGNIGVALSAVVEESFEVMVVEVSSFQLRFTEGFHPPTAVLINVASDHLDWHGSTYSYEAAKARIFANQTEADLLIYDADDAGAARLVRQARSRRHPVSASHLPVGGSGINDGKLEIGGSRLDLADLPASNPSLLVDLIAAGAAALDRGASIEAVTEVMSGFQVPPHRRTEVAEIAGVRYVDDSKATNPHAALAAVAAYRSVVLIAGGLAKGLDLRPLIEVDHVRHLVGLGAAGKDLVAGAGVGKATLVDSMKEAVEVAASYAQPGDVVLLAPGCASFDMFSSYADRGEAFTEAVRDLDPQERGEHFSPQGPVGGGQPNPGGGRSGGGEERSDEPEGPTPAKGDNP